MDGMTQAASLKHKSGLVFPLAFCLLPVLVFYGLLWRELRPVPIFDDYHAILYFVLQLERLHGPTGRLLYVIAAQHDEYKLIVEHALVAADWAATGRVHFGFLMLLGYGMVLGMAWVLWANLNAGTQALRDRLLLFAPVAYLLFQLNYVENLDWAMCSLQTLPVLWGALLSMHFLPRAGGRSLALACFWGWFASLSSANGFLLAPIGACLLIVTRRFRDLVVWCATFGFALVLYLYRYEHFIAPDAVMATGFGRKLIFWLQFLGGAAENMHHVPVRNGSVLLGLVILIIFTTVCIQRLYRDQPFFFCVAIWCFLSAAVVTDVRISQGLDLSLTERYKIYSDLLLVCCYSFALRFLRPTLATASKRKLYRVVCVAAVLFALGSDIFGYRYLVKRQRRVALGLDQFAADPARNSPEISLNGEPFAGTEPEFARAVLVEAVRLRVYALPDPSRR